MVHERFDLQSWIKRYPYAKRVQKPGTLSDASDILKVVYAEQERALARQAGLDLGAGFPVDVCLWNFGETSRRDVTKIGGVPYWPASADWPHFDGDVPYTFEFQFCFADSHDILPELPGDILCVLNMEKDAYCYRFEWFNLGEELTPPHELPEPQYETPTLNAVLHRTLDYDPSNKRLDQYPFQFSQDFQGMTKIGGYWFPLYETGYDESLVGEELEKAIARTKQHEREKQQQFVCALGSISANRQQPFLNVARHKDIAADLERAQLNFGDAGAVEFFFTKKGLDYEITSG